MRCLIRTLAIAGLAVALAANAGGLTDLTQTPNAATAGIAKSLQEEVGAGRGDATLPDSSRYLIARDPFRAIKRGRQIFQRKFTVAQGLGPRFADGDAAAAGTDVQHMPALGAGIADSCAGCHARPEGSAGFGGEVFTRPDSRDAPHLFGAGLKEMLADEMTADLRRLRSGAIAAAAQKGRDVHVALSSKGVGFGALTARPDGSVDDSGIRGVDRDLRIKPFFAQGGAFSLRQFSVGALADEMGLESPDPDLVAAANGDRVVTPSGMVLDGAEDALSAPRATEREADSDGDGVSNEVDPALVDYLEFYLLNYFKPATYRSSPMTVAGSRAMLALGCDSCHRPTLTIEHDRRVADVETAYDPVRGIFNRLFATATPLFTERSDDPALPPLHMPAGGPFVVRNFYSDLKRHDLGPGFWERNFDGSLQREFVTAPLWGVGSSGPYGHDGRSINLDEVILRHGGEAQASRDRYASAPALVQAAVQTFLESLVLFPPDDTASNLNPGDPTAPDFPQFGHGSIKLPALFLDPSDPE